MIAPGQRVGHYLIETRLGAGGMGEVFRAFDESLERPVAIKVLPKAVEGHPEARARMLREARAASALVHANIVTVHEVDEYDGQTILVMELVEGETLSHLLQRTGKRPVAEVLGIVRQVGSALAFAHQAGFVHRDIKCSNLMVMRDGRVKVLDFGLSKRMRPGEAEAAPDTRALRKPALPPEVATDPTAPAAPPGMLADARTVPGKSGADVGRPPSMPTHDSDAVARVAAAARRDDLTVEGAAMGTPGYSALELMDGQPADGRADVFSLGVVIYELLTAARPYSGIDWPGVRAQILAEKYTRARELVPSIPAELDAAIVRALRAERDVRTPSIEALLAELEEIATPSPRGRRRKTAVIALAFGGAAFAGGATFAAMKVRGTGGEPSKPADAVVALPPVDAGPPIDAAPPPPPAAVRMTSTNGCVYAPAFLDEHLIAFDLTTASGARDIAFETLPGVPRVTQRVLARAGSLEARPAPGAPGQLLYVSYDEANPARSAIRLRTLAGGAEQEVIPGAHTAVAAQDGAYYYVPGDSATLRRMRDKVDEAVLSLSSDVGMPVALVASREPGKLLVSGRIDQTGTLCVIEPATSTLDCLTVQEPLGARPDVGAGGTIYYASRGGIRGRTPSGDDRMVAAGALASGGLAVSPSGKTLVWSDCGPRQALRDTTVKPAADLTVAPRIVSPVAGPGGRLAWIEHGDVIRVRTANGVTHLLTRPRGGVILELAFSHDGERVVFRRGGEHAGLYYVEEATFDDGTPRLTDDPSDEAPIALADGTVVFTRTVDGHPSVFHVRAGGDPEPAMTEYRRTVDVDRGSGRVLLRSEDDRTLYWWDPVTGIETPGPQTYAPGTDVTRRVSLSPDGAWLLYRSGPDGHELWRTPERMWQPERVKLPADTVVEAATIDDDGHVLVVTPAMRGELWMLEALYDRTW